ncbi:hypothetical protein PHMEG_00028270 [Phytophthora megakarya]|uniref:Uncharacterized protein n=1 Tax=Phytophthora megakarya TaxID=4795 RepID=A0A225V7V6_9STRA|nr:hypothetical protein PHMEG_00028270 [Phytophthora megakarya]
MRESLEKELADDDFMLGLTAEGSVAGTVDLAPSKEGSRSSVSSSNTVAEVSADSSAGDGHHAPAGEDSVVKAPVEAGGLVDDASASESSASGASGLGAVHSPSPLPHVPKPGSAVPISQLLNDVSADLAELETPDSPAKDAGTSAVDGVGGIESSWCRLPLNRLSRSIPRSFHRGRGLDRSVSLVSLPSRLFLAIYLVFGTQGGSRLRRKTHVVTATVTARRGTDTSAFVPASTVVSRAANSRKITATAERFLEPGFAVVGAQKAWCQMLNVSLSESAPKDHISPLDFAFLALMYNVHSARHPWRVLFDRMPDEPLTFELGKLVQGVRISIHAPGHGGLVRMWRRFSGHCYENNEKIDLCVALWERRHWLQVSALDNAIRRFKQDSDPLDPFTHYHLNRMRNNRADLLRQQIDRLWEWCTSAGGRTRTLPTEVLLEPSYLQYSTEVPEWAPNFTDWFLELRVLDAKQPWRNCWIDAPAEHPYNTTYAPCNPSVPLFVPASMTRQAVVSSIVVDKSLADADLTAPWVTMASAAAEVPDDSSAETVEEGSVDIAGAPSAPVETCGGSGRELVLVCPCWGCSFGGG